MNAHKFKRFHWWIWVVAINALVGIPYVFMFRHSVLAAWDSAESGGQFFDVLGAMGKTFLWPWLPITGAVVAIALLLRQFFSTRPIRHFRHEVGLKVPVLGGRARNESVTIFTWVLSKLARGGVPPFRSWEMSVDSVPNLAMQDRLRHAGVMMNEGTRL